MVVPVLAEQFTKLQLERCVVFGHIERKSVWIADRNVRPITTNMIVFSHAMTVFGLVELDS